MDYPFRSFYQYLAGCLAMLWIDFQTFGVLFHTSRTYFVHFGSLLWSLVHRFWDLFFGNFSCGWPARLTATCTLISEVIKKTYLPSSCENSGAGIQ